MQPGLVDPQTVDDPADEVRNKVLGARHGLGKGKARGQLLLRGYPLSKAESCEEPSQFLSERETEAAHDVGSLIEFADVTDVRVVLQDDRPALPRHDRNGEATEASQVLHQAVPRQPHGIAEGLTEG